MRLPSGVQLAPMVDDAEDRKERVFNVSKFARATRKRIAQTGRVQETMGSSDFTYMADTIDRGTMVSYLDESIPITYPTLAKRRDTTKLVQGTNGVGVDYRLNAARVVDRVLEGGMYHTVDPSDESFEAHTYKFGFIWPITWEAWLADDRDLGFLMSYPQSFGLSARYTQQYLFTAAYAHNTTFFTAGRGNYMSGAGSQLDADNLDTAIHAIRNFADPAGNVSVYAGPLYLVVPGTLEFKARALVESTTIVTGDALTLPANNKVRGRCTVVVDDFLESLDETYGTTGWYLFADPRFRPAFRYGHLRGFDQPQVFLREADARMMAGGTADLFDGSFERDDIEMKLRFTFGVDEADWRGAYHSTGEAEAE
jgi:hypothetical protein